MTWNATGIMTGIAYLESEFKRNNIDICGLSEHWLKPENSAFLNKLINNYESYIVTSSETTELNNRRVGKGGVGFLWHSRLEGRVQPINVNDDRIAVIKVLLPKETFIIIQVYLPTSSYPTPMYRDYIDKLMDLYSELSEQGTVIIMGDFNSQIIIDSKIMRDRERYTLRALSQNNLCVLTDRNHCAGPRFTFVPYGPYNNSFIDHVLVPELLLLDISICKVLEDAPLNVSRHLPILLIVTVDNIAQEINDSAEKLGRTVYRWKNAENRNNYATEVDNILESKHINYENINENYDTIVAALKTAAEKYLPKREYKSYLKPYWNHELKALHASMRSARKRWLREGKPKHGSSYTSYKSEKRLFRRKLREVTHQFEREEYERIDNMIEIDQRGFWKAVNIKKRNKRAKQGCEIRFDSIPVREPNELVQGWQSYFTKLYDESNDDNFDDDIKDIVTAELDDRLREENSQYIISEPLCLAELETAIGSLPLGKASGFDNLCYEHIKYGSTRLRTIILDLFRKIISLEVIPIQFKQGLIITLYKGHNKSPLNPDNYRAITLMPVMSKLFEKVIQTRIEKSNIPSSIHPLQHGFQKGKSSKHVTFILQESINFCQERHSPLYACFLDAAKAFDKVWIKGL